MKKILIMFLIGGMFMLSPMDAFIKNTAENIVSRKNLTTGIVKTVNANLSFDVEIGNCGKITKQIFTLSPEPDLAVDDEVLIGCLKGNKEALIIFAPTVPAPLITIVRRYALIIAYPNELKVFDMEGAEIHLLTTGGWSYAGCAITMDADGNSYTETNWNLLRKWDSSGNLLVTHSREHWQTTFESLNIGPDGYLYTLEGRASGYAITKRSTVDLTVIEDAVILTAGNYGGAICLDSSGNFYIYNWTADEIEKWSSVGVKLASRDPGRMNEYAGCGVCGDYVYFVKDANEVYYLPLDLSTYTKWDLPVSIAYSLAVADNHLILSGWGTGGNGATRKYDSNRNLIWETFLGGSAYAYKAGGYNF